MTIFRTNNEDQYFDQAKWEQSLGVEKPAMLGTTRGLEKVERAHLDDNQFVLFQLTGDDKTDCEYQ